MTNIAQTSISYYLRGVTTRICQKVFFSPDKRPIDRRLLPQLWRKPTRPCMPDPGVADETSGILADPRGDNGRSNRFGHLCRVRRLEDHRICDLRLVCYSNGVRRLRRHLDRDVSRLVKRASSERPRHLSKRTADAKRLTPAATKAVWKAARA